MRAWTVVVYSTTLAGFTVAGILEERRQASRTEALHAAALLDHLIKMPEFRGSSHDVQSRLAPLNASLSAVGGTLELTRTPAESGGRRTAPPERGLALADGAFALRYRADPARLASITRRAIVVHSTHGLVALAALLMGTE